MPKFSVRKIYQGVATRQIMHKLFSRHHAAPWDDDRLSGALYVGEWFEITEDAYDAMLGLLPPRFMREGMFGMSEYVAGSVTSVFFGIGIDGKVRWFHAYCDMTDPQSIESTRQAIILREQRPVRAMTHQERLDHIWSTTADSYRSYDGSRQAIAVYSRVRGKSWDYLDRLTEEEVSAKLPVHLRFLPEAAAA